MLRLSPSATESMHRHAEAGYPLEICGFLVGCVEEGARVVRDAWPVRNAWEDDPDLRARMLNAMEQAGGASAERWEAASEERRFLISPEDTLAAMKRARQEKVDLIGVYHTHPNHPAIPSDFDRSAAWPEWSYVILSVREGRVAELRSWEVLDMDAPFTEEAVQS